MMENRSRITAVRRSPWSFRGKLHEEQSLFFAALAEETQMDPTIFMNISKKIISKYLRSTLQSMLQLTSIQMRNVIADCGSDVDWLLTIEDMLGCQFASSVEEARTVAVVQEQQCKPVQTSVRVSKFMETEERTLGRELYDDGRLDAAVLPDWVFEVVKTPNPDKRYLDVLTAHTRMCMPILSDA